MNKRQNDKMLMHYTTQNACERQIDTINSRPALKSAFEDFCHRQARIKELVRIQDMRTDGITHDKALIQEAMAEATLEIANGICCYAETMNKMELLGKARLTMYDIMSPRDFISLQRCVTIRNLTEEHLIPLGDYEITSSDLDDLSAKIALFENTIVKPRDIRAMKKASTAELKMLFREVDRILKFRMDRMVRRLRRSHPQFYRDYFNARMIIDTGNRHSKAATASDSAVVAPADSPTLSV